MPSRLGDDIDDFCIKCKRLTNHSVVSLLEDKPAKVRCRTCYHDHDFRNEVPLPSKKELKKAADLLAAALGPKAAIDLDGIELEDEIEEDEEDADVEESGKAESDDDTAVAPPAPAKKAAKKAAKR